MAPDRDFSAFNVIGMGFVQERHADGSCQHLVEVDRALFGFAMRWAAFYVLAAAVVIATHVPTTTKIILTAAN